MSCRACDEAEQFDSPYTYIRIENANMKIVGCIEHIGKLVEIVRDYYRREDVQSGIMEQHAERKEAE